MLPPTENDNNAAIFVDLKTFKWYFVRAFGNLLTKGSVLDKRLTTKKAIVVLAI